MSTSLTTTVLNGERVAQPLNIIQHFSGMCLKALYTLHFVLNIILTLRP